MNNTAYSFYAQDAATCPVLPDNMQRDRFISLIENCAGYLNVGRAALRTFRVMAELTRPQDFKDPSSEPICFMAQTEIAKQCNLDISRVRRHEAELQRAGLVEKRTMANGSRSGFHGCGIYFSAGIARVEELLEYLAHRDAERRHSARLRGLRSTHKKHLASILDELTSLDPSNTGSAALQEQFDHWPEHKSLHKMALVDLIEHEAKADALCRTAYDILQKIKRTRGRECENERPYIQDTTQETKLVNCNASVRKMTEDKSSEDNLNSSAPSGASHRLEESEKGDAAHTSEYLEKLSPKRLYALCSPEMQFYLDGRGSEPRALTAHDFELAAVSRLHELGINRSAWREACDVMGSALATICLLITDANRFNPDIPVRNPGGYLRGMTRAHQAGELNIVGGLIGLTERLQG